MIKINFIEPNTNEWQDWKNRCHVASQKVIADVASGIVPTFSALYKEQKANLFSNSENFYGKCAYCETLVTSNQPGDVEHFRPKGRVMSSQSQPVYVTDANGIQIPHPGYYWLAYQFLNLLPSCEDCNRPSKGNSGGTSIGKWDKFPVVGVNAFIPGHEVNEDPLLINPTIEDPDMHLNIDSLGLLHGKTPKGDTSIEVFGLNFRESLVDERKRAYRDAKDKVMLFLTSLIFKSADLQHYQDEIDKINTGKLSYSMARRKAIDDYKKENSNLAAFFNS